MSMARYREYKDSGIPWVGDVPAHWHVHPLVGVAIERSESNASMQENNLLSLSYGQIVRKNIESNDGLLPESFDTYQIVHEGDIVLRLTDLQNDKRSLRSAQVRERGIITSAYLALQPKGATSAFLSYLLRAYDLTKVFYSMGGGLRQSMKFADLKRMPIAVPPPSEQAAIVTFLDREIAKIDALIAEQEKLIALLSEKRQATLSHAVTKGLKPYAPMEDSGLSWLGEIPAHWTTVRVKTLSRFTTSGPRGWSERIAEDGSLFIQSGDLNDSMGLEYETAKRVNVGEDAEATRTRLAQGDVVVCITGAKTGNVALCKSLREPAYINQHLCLIRPAEKVSGHFLALALKSIVGQTQFELSQYGLKQGLSLENVRELWVTLPPRDEQEAIVSFVEAEMRRFTSLALAADAGVDLLKERRAAIIAAAVTGQIDVRSKVSQAVVESPEAIAA